MIASQIAPEAGSGLRREAKRRSKNRSRRCSASALRARGLSRSLRVMMPTSCRGSSSATTGSRPTRACAIFSAALRQDSSAYAVTGSRSRMSATTNALIASTSDGSSRFDRVTMPIKRPRSSTTGQMKRLRDQRTDRAAGHDDRSFCPKRSTRANGDCRRQRRWPGDLLSQDRRARHRHSRQAPSETAGLSRTD